MRKITIAHFYNKFIVAIVLIMGATVNSFAQCPTITVPIQSFCDVESPTVANLMATDNGGGIKWYISETSTTPLSNTLGLVNNTTYYVDDNSGACGARPSVKVVIYGPPITVNFQGFCVDSPSEATVSHLVATGNDVQWYDVATGGSPLSPSTILSDQTYYVDQSNPDTGCRTSRRPVKVSIGGVVPVPTGNAIQAFCNGDNATVANLQASGENRWYSTSSSGTPLDESTPLVNGATYYATTYNFPCESDERLEVTVVIQDPNYAGVNGEIEICELGLESTNTINLFDALLNNPDINGTWSGPLATSNGYTGTVNITAMTPAESPYIFTYGVSSEGCPTSTATVSVRVTRSGNPGTNNSLSLCINSTPHNLFDSLGGNPEPGGVWSPALASGSGVFDPLLDAAGVYTYTVKGVLPCGDSSATVTVSVNPEVDAGTNGNLTLCSNESPINLFDSLGGTPQTGGTWTPALASGSGLFDPAQDAAGVYIYTVFGIDPCADASATVTVEVIPEANAGTNGNLVLCNSDSPQNLFDSLGGTPQTGGTWSPALASGTGMFDPRVDAAGIYTYTVKGTSPCGDASATVEVTINQGVDPGISGTLEICSGSAPADLFDILGGNPQTGGTWSPALASGTGVFDPSVDTAGVYTYTVLGDAPCGNASATVTVIIDPLLDAGTNGSLTICENEAPKDLFNSLGGTPETGGIWAPALASGTGVFDPLQDAEGSYTYTVTTDCGQVSATVEVTKNPAANSGINGTLSICFNDVTPVDLFDSLGGTPESGGTWSPALASGSGIFDPTRDTAGTYTYTVPGSSPCGNSSSTVKVTIDAAPQAGLDGQLTLCVNDAPINLFNKLGGTPTVGGTWSPALTSGSDIFDPTLDHQGTYTYTVINACGVDSATVTININPQPDITGLTLSANDICLDNAIDIYVSGATQITDGNYLVIYQLSGVNTIEETVTVNFSNGNTIIVVPANQLTASGVTTFTIIDLINPVTNCGISPVAYPTVDFNINQVETLGLIEDGNQFCADENATITDLTNRLIGADIITWYDAAENGNTYTAETVLKDGVTYFASNMNDEGCISSARLAITVSIKSCDPLDIIIPDGFSPNGDNINDDFFIRNLRELYPNFQLQIYNRYGNVLYKGDNNTPNWDGRSNQGREVGSGVLPVGVYYFILELKDANNKTIQGRVYLNR